MALLARTSSSRDICFLAVVFASTALAQEVTVNKTNSTGIRDSCLTAQPTGPLAKCWTGVTWAMQHGIYEHPDWYPWHRPHMVFEDFQTAFHKDPQDQNECTKMPCPRTTTTTTTTTSTAPPGTPPCPDRKPLPPLPTWPTDNNGISWPEYCYTGYGEEHVFLVGDWGGLSSRHTEDAKDVRPADNTQGKPWRQFQWGVDDQAQRLVAEEMNRRAAKSNPRYILNCGDNFYWGGINELCSREPLSNVSDTNQWFPVFEDMYKGPGMDGKPWFSVLGNHDYGGFQFNKGWDQQIAYTYGGSPNGRWLLPALYWHQRVDYLTKNFSVDYYMVDTQIFDVKHPYHDPGHNICSFEHNGMGASCAPYGPENPWHCVTWFKNLWKEQMAWLDQKLNESTADWQIVVSHFPPQWAFGADEWSELADKYGIDLFVGAHRHQQELHEWGEGHMPWVVTGGGGGVTSEENPFGDSHQYGFMDMTISKDSATIENLDQHGDVRGRMTIHPREGWWQKRNKATTDDEEIGPKLMALAAPVRQPVDLYDVKRHPELTCDGMGNLLSNNSCGSTFDGAQVKGTMVLHVDNFERFENDSSARDAFQMAVAALAGVQEPMDVTIESMRPHVADVVARRLAGSSVDASFTIEAPSHEAHDQIGKKLNSKSFGDMQSALSQSQLLSAYQVAPVALSVDGFAAANRTDQPPTAESDADTTSGSALLLLFLAVILLFLCVAFAALAVYYVRSKRQKSLKAHSTNGQSRSYRYRQSRTEESMSDVESDQAAAGTAQTVKRGLSITSMLEPAQPVAQVRAAPTSQLPTATTGLQPPPLLGSHIELRPATLPVVGGHNYRLVSPQGNGHLF